MPVTPTYPGLYVEEVPSGVHPIVGAATADTAFVDYFARGPVNTPTRVTSFADFERVFGGLNAASEGSYAVLQYYLNGGQNAWIVRIDHGDPATATVTLAGGSPPSDVLEISASSPGLWGNALRVAVTQTVPPEAGRFNLFVQETRVDAGVLAVVATESHLGLTMDQTDPSYVATAVNSASSLIRVTDATGLVPPTLVAPTASGDAPASAYVDLDDGDEGDALETDGDLSTTDLADALEDGWATLDRIDPFIFNLLCVPAIALLAEANQGAAIGAAETFCEQRRAFLIVDPPRLSNASAALEWLSDVGRIPSANAAVYFPRVLVTDPLNGGRQREIGASGTIAGIYARTDAARGVWKAPAGIDATVRAATPAGSVNDADSGVLNPQGVNALRTFAVFGPVVWGARTLLGADQRASQWKYVPVRRTALYIENSLVAGLQWVVFEPNDEPLWAQIRLNVGAFMQGLFLQGAFQGTTPREAYLVKCDRTTTTQLDIDRGVVNILVGFAPLKPAEFVVIRIQQLAGQAQA
ncbi:phage tail sheath family protein [Phytohabitans rumicis]|uniref:Tail protein n=1 Tax=Phytohabitans rumicis TaxID=1076125 RepID=A0A6V8LF55_9ACTN|nr:phage tail sheath C-terminal domain-containing protein [Phytohabitans rumicis]GFJ92677.1 tail protein [Phytohabitans rumicis]